MEEESGTANSQLKQLEEERAIKEDELEKQTNWICEQLQEHQERTKEQILQTQGELENLRQQLAEENRKLDSKEK